MNNRKRELLIGYTILGVIIMLIFLMISFGQKSFVPFSGDYKVRVWFASAPGITTNSPVVKNGIPIGRVLEVKFVEEDTMVEVTLQIQKDRKIYNDDECRIKSSFIMGDSQIEFVKINTGKPSEPIVPETTLLIGVTPPDAMRMLSNAEEKVTEAIQNVSDAARNLSGMMNRINEVIGSPEELKDKQQKVALIFDDVNKTMKTYNDLGSNLNSIIGDPETRDSIRSAAKDAPAAIAQIKTISEKVNFAVDDIRKTLDKASGTFDKLDKNLVNVESFTEKLGADGPAAIDNLVASTKKLEVFFDELSNLLNAFGNSNGPLQQMVNDPEFFNDIQRTITNVRQITEQFKPLLREARPIVRNANVLTDKLAREPQKLGLAGMFDKSPPTKGLPSAGNYFGAGSSQGPYFKLNSYPSCEGGIYEFDEEGEIMYDDYGQNVPPRSARARVNPTRPVGPPYYRIEQVEGPKAKLWPFASPQYRYVPVEGGLTNAAKIEARARERFYSQPQNDIPYEEDVRIICETNAAESNQPEITYSNANGNQVGLSFDPEPELAPETIRETVVAENSYDNSAHRSSAAPIISFEPERHQNVPKLVMNIAPRSSSNAPVISFEPEPHASARLRNVARPVATTAANTSTTAERTSNGPILSHQVPPPGSSQYQMPTYR